MRAGVRKREKLRATHVAHRAAAALALLVCCGVAALAQAGSSLAEPPGARFVERGKGERERLARRRRLERRERLGDSRAGPRPPAARRLSRIVTRPAPRSPLLALSSDHERALALARLYRAVGLPGLMKGLEAAKPRVTRRLFRDPDVALYPGGREDLAAGRIDVRVLALLGYLGEEFGQVGFTSLQAGHRIYARPGDVSAHVHGLAVDIASVGGVPVGSQGPAEQTERLQKSILLLPVELRPRQVISLIALGGPSFARFDHDDHVHVGN